MSNRAKEEPSSLNSLEKKKARRGARPGSNAWSLRLNGGIRRRRSRSRDGRNISALTERVSVQADQAAHAVDITSPGSLCDSSPRNNPSPRNNSSPRNHTERANELENAVHSAAKKKSRRQRKSSVQSVKSNQERKMDAFATVDVDNPQIFTLHSLEGLLKYCKEKPHFIGIDIDETLIMTNKAPSWLLQPYGVAMFQQYLSRKFTDFQTKNRFCRLLEAALKSKRTVEGSKTVEVIEGLQRSGCWVFGVTARYSETARETEKTLASLGIHLGKHGPFPMDSTLCDPVTDAVCVNGIIYCSALSKGVIVSRIFANAVFSQSDEYKTVNVKDAKGFVFVDDNEIQLQSLAQLECAKNQNLPVECYLYRPESLQDDESLIPRDEIAIERGKVLMKQMTHFVETGEVLSNVEARALLLPSEEG